MKNANETFEAAIGLVAIVATVLWCAANAEVFYAILPDRPERVNDDNVIAPILPGGTPREPQFTTRGVPHCDGADPMGPGVDNDRMARWQRMRPTKAINGGAP